MGISRILDSLMRQTSGSTVPTPRLLPRVLVPAASPASSVSPASLDFFALTDICLMREALEISEGQWLVGHGGSLSSRVPRRLGSLSLPALRVPLSSRVLWSLWLSLPYLVLLGLLSLMVLSCILSILGFSCSLGRVVWHVGRCFSTILMPGKTRTFE